MKKSEAEVGVRVRVKGNSIGDVESSTWKGLKGTIRMVENVSCGIGVEFDKKLNVGGHNLRGLCKDGYGRWGFLREFEVIKEGKKGAK